MYLYFLNGVVKIVKGDTRIMKTKSEIRQEVLQALQTKEEESRIAETDKVIHRFLSLPFYQDAHTIGVTISNFPEFDTHQLIKLMIQDQKRVLCPVTLPRRQMNFIEIHSDTKFKKTKFGIWEPINDQKRINNQPDLLIVPGLKFALKSHQRIGFGGGFYDRFLSQFKGKTVSITLPEQLTDCENWMVEPTDITIDQIIH